MHGRAICTLLIGLAGCQAFNFARDGRPCDEAGLCSAGYACHPVSLRCIREGTAGDCSDPRPEIACNGIDDDCNGDDYRETGTLENCAGCKDNCMTAAEVAHATCEPASSGFGCLVRRCNPGFVDRDGDPSSGCEHACDNIDGDNLCDVDDTCIDVDGDGWGNGAAGNVGCAPGKGNDDDDGSPTSCADVDADECNDCTSGTFAPAQDGVDLNGDGLCHTVQPDEDLDGVGWAAGDPDDGDPERCGLGVGADSCDECSPEQDVDCDADTICDSDPREVDDVDGDGVSPGPTKDSDPNDCVATICGDTDDDGCDDCRKFATYARREPLDDGDIDIDRDGLCGDTQGIGNPKRDCDDTIPTCGAPATCSGADASASNALLPRCLIRWCLATFADPLGKNVMPDSPSAPLCRRVKTRAALDTAIGLTGTVYVLIELDDADPDTNWPMADSSMSIVVAAGRNLIVHQRAGLTLVSENHNGVGIELGSDNNELHELLTSVASPTNVNTAIKATSSNNVINGCTVSQFDNLGISIEGGSNNFVANNRVFGALGPYAADGSNANVRLSGTTNARVYSNVIGLGLPAGIVVLNSDDALIAHNTIHGAINSTIVEGDSLLFAGAGATGSSGACVRDNVLLRDNGATNGSRELLSFETETSAEILGNCSGNNRANHAGMQRCNDICDEASNECACLPASFTPFFGGALGFNAFAGAEMCIADATEIDILNQSGPQNRRGPRFAPTATPYFEGNGAEPGAREAHTPFCPGP